MSEEIWGSAAKERKGGKGGATATRNPQRGSLHFPDFKGWRNWIPVRNGLQCSKNSILHTGIFTNYLIRKCVWQETKFRAAVNIHSHLSRWIVINCLVTVRPPPQNNKLPGNSGLIFAHLHRERKKIRKKKCNGNFFIAVHPLRGSKCKRNQGHQIQS